jgi:hypothetical protein
LKEIQQDEAKELAKTLKTVENDDEKKEIKKYLQKLKNKTKSDAENEKLRLKRRQEIQENKKRLAEGKNPFYVKKCKLDF